MEKMSDLARCVHARWAIKEYKRRSETAELLSTQRHAPPDFNADRIPWLRRCGSLNSLTAVLFCGFRFSGALFFAVRVAMVEIGPVWMPVG